MDKKITVRELLSQTFTAFGITILLLNLFVLIFGGIAGEYSTIFALGTSGLTVATALQFFVACAAATLLRMLFLTDNIIKDMPPAARMTALFASLLAVTVAFVLVFGWFPANNIAAWICFAVCFITSCAATVLIYSVKEKQDNRALEKALEKFKEEH